MPSSQRKGLDLWRDRFRRDVFRVPPGGSLPGRRVVQHVPEGTYMDSQGQLQSPSGGPEAVPWGLVLKLYFIENVWFHLPASEELMDFTEKCFR